ncbi:Ig-like domain-containing protein [Lutibacter flavus]|uniref:Ig-like domain-containing protein n=1 Tax=Lutibacter flavus TaxID=691689 RepID=A0A238X8Z9_9FLAO|nr:Ig-like domain-containing protein [Lutibacter flavus]SNR55078.1 Ig-like domain-containing protein [Lutibacter flavus]
MRLSLSKLLHLFFIVSILASCARRGTPTGGEKDSIPPILVKSLPINESVNFKDKKIKIYFDEYIKLKDVKTQLVISPPQKNEPIITPVGTASKFISIKILDTLDANTTYVYNFGNSIVDNNEENKLGNFKYIFSTGTYIDSLLISGEVTDPSVKESATNLDVMLYEYDSTFTDSIVFKQKPRYIANTLDSTLFEITNIREGKYLLIALKDANNNKVYDPDIDKIGFVKDTITLPTEKIFNFSIFKEIPEFKIIKPKEVTKGHLIFGYKGNPKDLDIKISSETPANFKSEIIYEVDKDTINYWYTPFEADSLNFSVSKGDYFEELTTRLRSSKLDTLKITKGKGGNTLNLIDTLTILSNTPIINIDTTLISIIDQDTLNVAFKTILAKSKSKLYLNFDKKPASKYTIDILPNAITDIYEMPNDTLSFQVSTKTPEDYGILNIEVVSAKKSSFIVELLDSKDAVIRIGKINKPGIVNFESLDPGSYFVRITIDENNNGIWDTGSFLEKRQPEIVKFFDKLIELRANWDITEPFIVE